MREGGFEGAYVVLLPQQEVFSPAGLKRNHSVIPLEVVPLHREVAIEGPPLVLLGGRPVVAEAFAESLRRLTYVHLIAFNTE